MPNFVMEAHRDPVWLPEEAGTAKELVGAATASGREAGFPQEGLPKRTLQPGPLRRLPAYLSLPFFLSAR